MGDQGFQIVVDGPTSLSMNGAWLFWKAFHRAYMEEKTTENLGRCSGWIGVSADSFKLFWSCWVMWFPIDTLCMSVCIFEYTHIPYILSIFA